jgi:peptidoglycan/LPS O-acetylase OafA/YrhL
VADATAHRAKHARVPASTPRPQQQHLTAEQAAAIGRPEAEHGFRPDVQGLRAIAVGLVVFYHLYPSKLSGGYVGVDVFFVISGYLITGHLARGFDRGHRVKLLDFYGRRARRLRPAAALVLTVTWLLSRAWLPSTQLDAAAKQIRASALYFQNWTLAHNAVNYLTQGQAATPVEHFWSLSVEEQFYLVWPLLFLISAAVVALVVHRSKTPVSSERSRRLGRACLLVLAVAVVISSLTYSVLKTNSDPAAAYFITPTRMWELGLGGVLALLPAALIRRVERAGVLAWIGLAAIVASAVTMSGTTAFPGWVAIVPTLGAVAMIACGSGAARFGTAPFTASRLFVFVGDISYSLYLWHWPIIVLWLAYHGGSIGYLDGPAIVLLSVLLSWLTKVLVEDKMRRAKIVVRSPGVSLATACAVIVPAVLATLFIAGEPGPWNGRLTPSHPGAAVLAGSSTSDPYANAPVSSLDPPIAEAHNDITLLNHNGCEVGYTKSTPTPCTLYAPAHPKATVVLVGDSHASMWSNVLITMAKQQGWKLIGETHAKCRWTSAMMVLRGKPYTACHDWGQAVLHQLLTTIKPDVVIASERAASGTVDHPQSDAVGRALVGKGMVPYFRTLLQHSINVVAIHETPNLGFDVPDCLAKRNGSIAKCSTPADEALQQHKTSIDAAKAVMGDALPVVNVNDLLCTPTVCPGAVGKVIGYRDNNHLSLSMTRTLEPYFAKRLLATGAFSASG